jgi:hypothetical protein
MDKFLYRQKNTGFRQSDRLTVGRPDRDVIACHYAGSLTDAMPGLVEKAGPDVVPGVWRCASRGDNKTL